MGPATKINAPAETLKHYGSIWRPYNFGDLRVRKNFPTTKLAEVIMYCTGRFRFMGDYHLICVFMKEALIKDLNINHIRIAICKKDIKYIAEFPTRGPSLNNSVKQKRILKSLAWT